MPEIVLVPSPARSELRAALRRRLGDLGLGLRVIAEDLLGAEGPIDLVALDPDGGVVLALLGEDGDAVALVGRALAQRVWVEARLQDWIQLAPRLGITPGAHPRLLLVAPEFGAPARAAASALGSAIVDLATYRCVRNGGAMQLLLERVGPSPRSERNPAPSRPVSSFRSGLGDADLSLTPEERGDLE